MYFAKEKQLYKTLNMLKKNREMFAVFFWGPVEDEIEFTTAITSKYRYASIAAY